MKIGFVELVAKLAKKDRRPPTTLRNKYSPLQAFRSFTQIILPKIETRIQEEMLKRKLERTNDKAQRRELIDAYLRRLMRLRYYDEEEIKSYKRPRPTEIFENTPPPDPSTLKPLNEHTLYDVGSYMNFLPEDMQKFFKHECFGIYTQAKVGQFFATRKFGVQIRQDGIRIVDVLKRIQSTKPVDWQSIMAMSKQQREEYVNDENNYMHLFNDLSNRVYEQVKGLREEENFKRTWGSSVVSDTLVNSVLRQLHNLEDPFAVLKEAVETVKNLKVAVSPGDFNLRYQHFDLSTGRLPLINKVADNARFFWRTPSFKNVFLGGEGGTGRSMILAYVSMWAFKNNWVVITCPSGYRMNNDRDAYVRRCYNGLFLTPDHALRWLQQFRQANLDFLKNTKVNLDLYGKCDISGRHADEYEPVANIYDERRKVHFNEVAKLGLDDDVERDNEDKKTRMSIALPKPDTLNDIAIIGMKDRQLSTCAIAQLLEQIYELDHPTLVCVDGFNWFYRPCWYNSFRYHNDRGLGGHIPPYHMALSRLFMDLDGHRIKKGLKVVASSNYPLFKHKFDIKKLLLPRNYEQIVPPMTHDEFQKAAAFNILSKWWMIDGLNKNNPLYMYTLCQGNWMDFQEAISKCQTYR